MIEGNDGGILRSGAWLTRARARRVAIVMLVVTTLSLLLLFATATGTLDAVGRPLGTDFSQVHVAGQMVLDGRAAEVWDWEPHFLEQQRFHGSDEVPLFGWHYPPPFLLVAAALATLPYVAALLAYQAVTLGMLGALARAAAKPRDILLFLVGAPVTLICIAHGHNGFLTAFLLGGGLWLVDRRPFLAGLLFGALVYKPHFALLLPPLLLVIGAWRAIAGAALSSLGLIALTYAIWGWDVWQAFFDSLTLTQTIVLEAGQTGFHKIMSTFAWVRLWGGSVALAYAAQAAATILSIGVTLWLARHARPDLWRAAAAVTALLATPYLLDYDLVAALVALFFLWRDGERSGWLAWDKTLLAAAWVTPLIARSVAQWAYLPIGCWSLWLLLWLAWRRHRAATASS